MNPTGGPGFRDDETHELYERMKTRFDTALAEINSRLDESLVDLEHSLLLIERRGLLQGWHLVEVSFGLAVPSV